MATKKVSAMTPATALTGAELVPIVQGGANKSSAVSLLMGNANVFLESIRDFGSVAIGMTSAIGALGTLPLVDGRLQMVAVRLLKAGTVTGVKWVQVTQGNYTADQNNRIGLYSQAAGVLTLVASTANDGDLWKSLPGVVAKAFSAPVALAVGTYYVGYLYNSSAQTTAPQISGITMSVGAQLLDMTNSNVLCSYVAANDLVPSTTAMSTITGANATAGFFLLY